MRFSLKNIYSTFLALPQFRFCTDCLHDMNELISYKIFILFNLLFTLF